MSHGFEIVSKNVPGFGDLYGGYEIWHAVKDGKDYLVSYLGWASYEERGSVIEAPYGITSEDVERALDDEVVTPWFGPAYSHDDALEQFEEYQNTN